MNDSVRRLNVALWTLAVGTVLWLAAGDRVLTHLAYAVERGRLQASDEELAELHARLPEVHAVSRAFKLVAKVARPGVVHLFVSGGEPRRAEIDARLREELRGLVPDDQLEYWLQRPTPGMGSGFVIDEEGHIVTNHHVVAGREEIGVVLYDEREYQATLVGTDPKTDLAVIKIDAPDLHPLRFGDSDAVEVGDWVIAVGAPFGLSQTVTHGIVSAKGRKRVDGVGIQYQDFIQTDAAINPGNSGGPLLNLRGEVVGVNTAIATRGEGNAGIAFTIPSNLAAKIVNQLQTSGTVRRGWLGVSLAAIAREDAEILGLPARQGVLIDMVLRDTPASRAGLQVDDVVLAINDLPVSGVEQFRSLVADLAPDELARFEIVRDGDREDIDIQLGLQPDDISARSSQMIISRSVPQLGLGVRTLRPGLKDTYPLLDFGVTDRGLIVIEVQLEQSAGADVRPGELLVACNGRSVRTLRDLREALRLAPVGETVRLEVKEPTGDRRIIRVTQSSADR